MDFLAAVLAIVALIFVLKMRKRVTDLELRIAALTGGIQAAPQAPPEMPRASEQPFVAAEPATSPDGMEHAALDGIVARAGADQAAAPPPPPPPPDPAEPGKSFEERFGASWVVWIGGIALALGGIFLVQFSIEAGLIGPGVRIFLGGLLAAALVAAGEWLRRKESGSDN